MNGWYTSYPTHNNWPAVHLRYKGSQAAFTWRTGWPWTQTLFSSESGRSKLSSKTAGTKVKIKIQLSIHQMKALSEVCRTITVNTIHDCTRYATHAFCHSRWRRSNERNAHARCYVIIYAIAILKWACLNWRSSSCTWRLGGRSLKGYSSVECTVGYLELRRLKYTWQFTLE